MKGLLTVIVSLALSMVLVGNASAFPPATWQKGDEKAVFGHTFDEEYWTNESVKAKSPAGDNVTFSASYVNASNVQAFLLSLNMIENANGTGTVPFQLFGMHYFTPEKREVFIGAVFAFLMAFDDTYNGTGPGQNGLPDPGHEQVYYVMPFGAGSALGGSYLPEAHVLPVQKLGPGHYKFGMQYLNLYAFVTQNFLASLVYRTGWIAKFSELTISYEITMDNSTGQVKVESSYTIGQVTQLWLILLGIPIPVNPHGLPANMGISVIHFMTVFTSRYQGVSGNSTGHSIDPNITAPLEQDLLVKVGSDGERAMKIGTRGTFDLINESSGAVLKSNQPAMNAIVSAKAVDLLLVGWQLGFAGGAMSIFAYALSDYVKTKYSGPLDLAQRSLIPGNADGFNAHPLWYAVSFPQWNGYKVVHDPVYTAYVNMNTGTKAFNPAGFVVMVLIVVVVAAVVVLATRRKKGP